jgi:hypothetical protein
VVEGTGLENRHTGNGIESSNLSLSVYYDGGIARGAELSAVRVIGRVAEWFKAHAWKVCVR